ncbi:hypothetical protein L484_006326 [Morus notabilis]|uniref:EF-hand domain-containing protein n=1 Tax=Morus notabilis TaxID=981085 RepID=W9SAL1_9ROSA|nr:hypothetical protein L484_006326 [Morus notabilis]
MAILDLLYQNSNNYDQQKEKEAGQAGSRKFQKNGRSGEAQTKQITVKWTKDQLTELFKSFDKNNDGMLSFEEVELAFRRLGPHTKLWALFRAEKFDCHANARRGMDYGDLNNDERINLHDTELTELVNFTYEKGYKL